MSLISLKNKSFSNDPEQIFHGWLYKQGGKNNWHKRYFRLFSYSLMYFRNNTKYRPLGSLSSTNLSISELDPFTEDQFAFVTYERTIFVKANDLKDKKEWMKAVGSLNQQMYKFNNEKTLSNLKKKNGKRVSIIIKDSEDNIKILRKSLKTDNNNTPLKRINSDQDINRSSILMNNYTSNNIGTNQQMCRTNRAYSEDRAKRRKEIETCEAILEDELGIKYFKEFLKTEFSEQQLDFYVNSKKFKLIIEEAESMSFDDKLIETMIERIIFIQDNYIKDGTETTINISIKIRETISECSDIAIQAFNNGTLMEYTIIEKAEIFNNILKIYECTNIDVFKMLRGSFRRFKKSDIFDKMVKEIVKNNSEIQTKKERGRCLRDNCECEIFKFQKNDKLKRCMVSECGHFYEEHQIIEESKEKLQKQDNYVKQISKNKINTISGDQRRKLQLLLGMSVKDFFEYENELNSDSRNKFLVDTLSAIITSPTNSLKIRETRIKFKRVKDCFIGSELVECIKKRLNISSKESVNIASEMMDYQLFFPIIKRQTRFIDSKFYYILTKTVKKEIQKREKEMNEERQKEITSEDEVSGENLSSYLVEKEEEDGNDKGEKVNFYDMIDTFNNDNIEERKNTIENSTMEISDFIKNISAKNDNINKVAKKPKPPPGPIPISVIRQANKNK